MRYDILGIKKYYEKIIVDSSTCFICPDSGIGPMVPVSTFNYKGV